MKSIILKLMSIVLLSIVLNSCTSEDDGVYTEFSKVENVNVSYTVMEYEIIRLINQHRDSIGLNPLNIYNIISIEAEEHTDYMIVDGQPSHDNFSIRHKNLVNKAKAETVAENVAYGYRSALGVVKAWLNSKLHRTIIENGSYTDFGISTKQDIDGRNYFTIIFIKK